MNSIGLGRGIFTKRAIDEWQGKELRFSGLSVSAASDSGAPATLLEDIDLTLKPGEWLNVVGVNGSGKSTLARLLAGLYLDGRTGLADRGFAGSAASPVVLQRPESQLFGETPREEVQFALEWREVPPEHMESITKRVLEAVSLTALADTRWEGLSGGQRQLAAVAAAVAGYPRLLVFDEATSMLDEGNRAAVLDLAHGRHEEGTAVVWVTQRLDELRPEERTIAVADGRIVYDGATRAFFYGNAAGHSPCESCGLRLPYLAALALQMEKRGRLTAPLPLSADEWREVVRG